MTLIPGVVDLNLPEWSTGDLGELVEAAGEELATRQTRDAIARDVTAVMDPIIRENPDVMGEPWESGRVSWDGRRLSIECEEG